MAVSVCIPLVYCFLVKVVNQGPGTLLLQALECFSLKIPGLPDSEMRCCPPHYRILVLINEPGSSSETNLTQYSSKAAKQLMKMQQPKPCSTPKVLHNNYKHKKHWHHSFFPWSDFITKFMRTYSITREFVYMRKQNKAKHGSLTNL